MSIMSTLWNWVVTLAVLGVVGLAVVFLCTLPARIRARRGAK